MGQQQMRRKVERLHAALISAGVGQRTTDSIMQGAQAIPPNDQDALRAWFAGAMLRMDEGLDEQTSREVREACACCRTGKRAALAKAIFKENDSFEKRFAAFAQERYIVGHAAEIAPDGHIRVRFFETPNEGTCPCLAQHEEAMSLTYCMCCGGHIRTHLETALGVTTKCTVLSTKQASGGRENCAFDYEILSV